VNEVAYQPGYSDQFYHRYKYDPENKLTGVFTSPDRVVWEQEADYIYYRHGPLARVELGQMGVQGVDYAYTLQGWLKTVNSTAVTASSDMGGDGTLTGRKIAADVYGFALHYNSTDFKAINLSKTVVAPVTSTALPAFKDLYNGNIAAMAVTFRHTSFGAAGAGLNQPLLYKYRYDQLNRIKEMDAYSGLNQTTNAWSFGSPLTAYQERVSYDGNGNILTYTRNGDAARTAMDNMTYSYVSGTNKLDKVVDAATDATPANYPNYNDLKTGQATGNYAYDAIGNLIKDASEGISSGGIVWNVYGKIASVTKSGVTTSYTYDASGNRISKTTGGKTTWYVRDASGNVMAVYESGNAAVNGGNLSQIEVHLYGSSRLGMWTPNRNVQSIPAPVTYPMTGLASAGVVRTYKRGQKFFELSNHLGNVLVTVTDRKVAIQNGTTGTILNYVADVVSGGDYYPFGMQMPSRNYSTDKYRYGFNGKEKSQEIGYGDFDFGARVYDGRIGKWLSMDPLQAKYPGISPFTYCYNSPQNVIDPDGKLGIHVTVQYNATTKSYTILKIVIDDDLKAVAPTPGKGNIGMDYHNYASITFVDGNGKVISEQNKTMSFRTNNWFLGKDWAKRKVDDGAYETRGGICWTSQDGGNQETRSGQPSHTSNLELLMAAINITSSNASLGDGSSEFNNLEFLTKITALLEKIADQKPSTLKPADDPRIQKDLEELRNMLKEYEQSSNSSVPVNTTPKLEPGKRSFVFRRKDNFGTGPKKEKKNSIQNHAYVTDSTIRKIPAKDGSGVDTFEVKQKRSF